MGLFYSLTIFSFGSMILYLDHQKILNFNFHFSLQLFSLQITAVVNEFFNFSIRINHLLFCLTYSLVLALLIFPYFKYLFRTTLNYYSSKETPFQVEGIKGLSPLYRLTFVLPLIISLLWVNFVSDFMRFVMSEAVWEHFRIGVVLFYSLLRIYSLRTEVQNLLDQSKAIIYEIIRNPSEDNKKQSEIQCKAIGGYAWPLAYQSLCYSLFIVSLCLLLLCKGELHKEYPLPVRTVEAYNHDLKEFDENEFIFNNTAIVTPSMTVFYYKEIKELENKIKSLRVERKEFNQVIEQLVNSKYVPFVFYRDLIAYAIWLYHFSTVFAFGLTVLYKKRFYSKLKKA